MHRPTERAGVISALAASLLWGASLAFTRLGVVGASGLGPADLALLRFLLPALVLAPALARLRLPRPAVLAGMLGGGVPFVMLAAAGLGRVNTAEAGALLPGAFPLCVALLGSLIGSERIGPLRGAGLSLIAASTLLLVGTSQPGRMPGAGHSLLLGAAMLSALQALAFRHAGLPARQAIALVSVGSTLILLLLHGRAFSSGIAGADPILLAIHAVLQGGLAGLLGPLLFAFAIRCLGAARAASFAGITPLAAAAFGTLLLGETPDAGTAVAAFGTAAGVVLANQAGYPGTSRAST